MCRHNGDLDTGWLAVSRAAVLELANRQIVGWATAGHSRTSLVIEAIDMALGQHRPGTGLLHHSDRGSQALLQRHGILPSMSRKDDCWDNAVMERFFGTLKSEWTDSQRYASQAAAEQDVIRFIEMAYNSDRDHSTIGYRTPRERTMAAVA